jgi:type I restriction enzyme, S subunit
MRAMKESGTEWLGQVPESWTVRPHWSVMRESKRPVGNLHTELDLLSLTKQGVIIRDLDGGGKFPANFESYQQVEVGDLILCLFDVEETPRTVGLAPAAGMITSAYTVMRISDVDPGFLEWYLIGMDNEKKFKPFYSGLRNTLSKDVFGSIRFAMPPIDEQKAIVAYLNQETSQIEALISKKEQLIEKLLERRQALITHVVTKGLDPNAPMKDSGVEWLGAIPAQWTCAPLWTKLKFSTGWTPPSGDDSNYGGEIPWANISDLGSKIISSTKKHLSVAGLKKSKIKLSPPGSLLFSFKLSIGLVSFTDVEMYTNEAIATFFESPYINLRFAYYMLPLTVTENCSWNIYGARMLNDERIRQARIVIPPFSEQETIANHLDDETFQIDQLLERTQRAIQLLKERRQALITQVVTGKIDVRGFAGGNS